jgi:heme exporter protein D
MREFLEMGGYAAFVWPAYGVTALVLLLLLADSMIRLRRRQAELTRLEDSQR